MKKFKVLMVCSHWYEKTIEAESLEQAQEDQTLWGDDLGGWDYLNQGEGEIYEIKELTQ